MKETYIEINLRELRKNIDLIKKEIQEQPTMIMAVVKGNAYGHGMVEISKSIENEIDYFGVGFLEEGIKLRVEGRKKPILLSNIKQEYSLPLNEVKEGDELLKTRIYNILILKGVKKCK